MHNRNYWLGGSYLGYGMGAHGFDGKRRTWKVSRLQDYLERVYKGDEVIEGYEDLTEEQLSMEKVLFGLRMNEGIPWGLVPARQQELIQPWIKDGFLLLENQQLRTTDQGRLVLDELSVRLI